VQEQDRRHQKGFAARVVVGDQDEGIGRGAHVLQAMHRHHLPTRDQRQSAQQQAIAKIQMGQRVAENIAGSGKARAEARSLGNVGRVHGAGLCGVRGRLTRITYAASVSAPHAASR
jgi:hypothetical protein